MPMFEGSAFTSPENASRPPAEAPTPTTGNGSSSMWCESSETGSPAWGDPSTDVVPAPLGAPSLLRLRGAAGLSCFAMGSSGWKVVANDVCCLTFYAAWPPPERVSDGGARQG